MITPLFYLYMYQLYELRHFFNLYLIDIKVRTYYESHFG